MGKLRDALLREAEEDARKAAREIVSAPAEGGAFSRALRQDATSDDRARQHREIVTALRTNPELVSSWAAERAFRNAHPWIPDSTMSSLINEARGRAK